MFSVIQRKIALTFSKSELPSALSSFASESVVIPGMNLTFLSISCQQDDSIGMHIG